MKCLPASKLSQANGVALHDWHAEVLTLRAFNRFILDECRRLAQYDTAESDFLRRRTKGEFSSSSESPTPTWNCQPFAWRDGLTLHMYCSEAPCTPQPLPSPLHTTLN
jgi:tRNA-specific adenosine deaminase 1